MTVGEWLAMLPYRRGVACGELRRIAEGIARRLLGSRAAAEHERSDLVADALVAALEGDGAALRRGSPELPVSAWLDGTMRRLLAAERESMRRSLGRRVGDVDRLADTQEPSAEAKVGTGRAGEHPVLARSKGPFWADRAHSLLTEADRSVLTRKQREVYDLFWDGRLSIAAIAHRLRLDWHTTHERLARALKRLRDGPPAPPPDRAWAAAAAESPETDETTRLLLRRFAAGATYRELAAHVGSTRNAVKLRIRRMRRAAGPRTSG